MKAEESKVPKISAGRVEAKASVAVRAGQWHLRLGTGDDHKRLRRPSPATTNTPLQDDELLPADADLNSPLNSTQQAPSPSSSTPPPAMASEKSDTLVNKQEGTRATLRQLDVVHDGSIAS